MNVSLTPFFEEYIQRLVSSGKYNSASEVVREALRLFQDEEEMKTIRKEEMRKLVQNGLDSGSPASWDTQNFLDKMRKDQGS